MDDLKTELMDLIGKYVKDPDNDIVDIISVLSEVTDEYINLV